MTKREIESNDEKINPESNKKLRTENKNTEQKPMLSENEKVSDLKYVDDIYGEHIILTDQEIDLLSNENVKKAIENNKFNPEKIFSDPYALNSDSIIEECSQSDDEYEEVGVLGDMASAPVACA